MPGRSPSMSTESKKETALEIAHILFIDIVGYSKLSINEQNAAVEELNQIVRASEQLQLAHTRCNKFLTRILRRATPPRIEFHSSTRPVLASALFRPFPVSLWDAR